MEDAIDTIRAALAANASPDDRGAGAQACRAILAELEPATPMASVTPKLAGIIAAMRGIPADQLIEVAIAKLRASLPPGVNVEPVKPFNVFRVPVLG